MLNETNEVGMIIYKFLAEKFDADEFNIEFEAFSRKGALIIISTNPLGQFPHKVFQLIINDNNKVHYWHRCPNDIVELKEVKLHDPESLLNIVNIIALYLTGISNYANYV